jgi:hypothetical protein
VTLSTRQAVKAAPRPKMSPHDRGIAGMRSRWGPHGRIVRLDQLDPVTKGIVEAILTAQANAKAAAEKAQALA